MTALACDAAYPSLATTQDPDKTSVFSVSVVSTRVEVEKCAWIAWKRSLVRASWRKNIRYRHPTAAWYGTRRHWPVLADIVRESGAIL
jgi:hypothetical protein